MRRLFRTLYWPLIITLAIGFGIYSRFWPARPVWTAANIPIENAETFLTKIVESKGEVWQFKRDQLAVFNTPADQPAPEVWWLVRCLATGELLRKKVLTRFHADHAWDSTNGIILSSNGYGRPGCWLRAINLDTAATEWEHQDERKVQLRPSPLGNIIQVNPRMNPNDRLEFIDRVTSKSLFEVEAWAYHWSPRQTWLITARYFPSHWVIEIRDPRTGHIFSHQRFEFDGVTEKRIDAFHFIDENTFHFGWPQHRPGEKTLTGQLWEIKCDETNPRFTQLNRRIVYSELSVNNGLVYFSRQDGTVMFSIFRQQSRWPTLISNILVAMGCEQFVNNLRMRELVGSRVIDIRATPNSFFPIVRLTHADDLISFPHPNSAFTIGTRRSNGDLSLYSLHPRMPGWLLQLLLTTIILLLGYAVRPVGRKATI